MSKLMRLFGVAIAIMGAAAALAGNLVVTSPTSGSGPGADDSPFLGKTNTIRFNITEAVVQVSVQAVITGPDYNNSISTRVTPDADGKASGTLTWTFSDSAPEGDYVIVVSATEPGNTYEPTTLYVRVDVKSPKIIEFSPANASFTNRALTIRATIDEGNIKEWRVRVNGADIPNNTGTSNNLAVFWDPASIERDGSQRIEITVTDRAENEASQTINVTLDRVAPVISIQYPRIDSVLRPNSTTNVIVDFRDVTTRSIDVTGMDIIATRTDGSFLFRIPRSGTANVGSDTLRWIGRIRHHGGLPRQIRIVARAIDRAGNRGTEQIIIVNYR